MSLRTPEVLHRIISPYRETWQSLRHWQEEPVISREELVESLRMAAVISPEYRGLTRFFIEFPYFKEVEGKNFRLLFRRAIPLFSRPRFCLDIAKPHRGDFFSYGWIDVCVEDRLSSWSPKREKPFGEVLLDGPIEGIGIPPISRLMERGERKKGRAGIYVNPELRSNYEANKRTGVAKALATLARIVLATQGLTELIAQDVVLGGRTEGFYKSLGAVFFDKWTLEDGRTHADAILPTQETSEAPYILI